MRGRRLPRCRQADEFQLPPLLHLLGQRRHVAGLLLSAGAKVQDLLLDAVHVLGVLLSRSVGVRPRGAELLLQTIRFRLQLPPARGQRVGATLLAVRLCAHAVRGERRGLQEVAQVVHEPPRVLSLRRVLPSILGFEHVGALGFC